MKSPLVSSYGRATLPVPSVRTLAKSSSLSFLEVLDASLGAPGVTMPAAACALSRLLLAPAWPTVAGTWWATVAAIWGGVCLRIGLGGGVDFREVEANARARVRLSGSRVLRGPRNGVCSVEFRRFESQRRTTVAGQSLAKPCWRSAVLMRRGDRVPRGSSLIDTPSPRATANFQGVGESVACRAYWQCLLSVGSVAGLRSRLD